MTDLRKQLLSFGDTDVEVSIFTNSNNEIVNVCLDNEDSVILDTELYNIRPMGYYPHIDLKTFLLGLAEKNIQLVLADGDIVDDVTGEVLLDSDEYELISNV